MTSPVTQAPRFVCAVAVMVAARDAAARGDCLPHALKDEHGKLHLDLGTVGDRPAVRSATAAEGLAKPDPAGVFFAPTRVTRLTGTAELPARCVFIHRARQLASSGELAERRPDQLTAAGSAHRAR